MSAAPLLNAPALAAPAPRIALEDVNVRLGGREIVRGAQLALDAGRFVALIGPNGAGKTTLVKAIAGLLPATGAVRINGVPIAAMAPATRARTIAYLPQGHHLHWPLTARDVVALGRYPHGLADPARLEGDHARAVHAAMARTDTLAFADQDALTLSGGERARVMLARVMAVEAPILIADEPTAALDPRHQLSVMQSLKAETQCGALILVVTHDIALAARLADEVVLMDGGRIIAHGPPADVLTDARLAESYGVSVIRHQIDGETLVHPWGLT